MHLDGFPAERSLDLRILCGDPWSDTGRQSQQGIPSKKLSADHPFLTSHLVVYVISTTAFPILRLLHHPRHFTRIHTRLLLPRRRRHPSATAKHYPHFAPVKDQHPSSDLPSTVYHLQEVIIIISDTARHPLSRLHSHSRLAAPRRRRPR